MDPLFFRGLGDTRVIGAPLIVTRTEDDFVDALLAELRGNAPIDSVREHVTTTRDGTGTLRLYQPVHRTFHVAVLELGCDTPGQPRLDPRKIDSCGMLVRRTSRLPDTRNSQRQRFTYSQAWVSDGTHVRGWVSFDSAEERTTDPEPARRPQPNAGPAEATARLRSLLAAGRAPLSESIAPLFVSPPDACAAAKRTVLFGMIPTTSSDAVNLPRQSGERFFDENDIRSLVPAYFRNQAPPSLGSVAGQSFSFAEASAREQQETRGDRSGWYLKNFLTMLRQLVTQFRAFDDTAQARALLATLNRVSLPFGSAPEARPAGDYLQHAAQLLVLEADPARSTRVELPASWPVFPADVASAITRDVGQLAETQFAGIAPRALRFDDLSARYELQAFVRIKRDDGCPPLLVWSEPSEPFAIAPWYENGGVAPVAVQMPDLTRESVKALRPNVTFKLPKRLFNFLNENDPRDLLDGKGKEGTSIGLDWICGFNIPIITICAFIVLFIFLALLNLIFWWLPFIRICFPIPSLKKEGS
jgi:hypothetical protein